MGTSFIYIVIAIAIIGSIVSSVAKSNKGKNKKSNNSNTQTRPSAPQQRSGGLDLVSEIKNSSTKSTTKTSFQEEADKAEKQKQISFATTHSHPSAQRNIKIEKSFVENSMGEHQSQGCSEHYLDRYVLIEENIDKNQSGLNKDLAKYIVMGEVLNKPGFKKYRR